jgi:hypothetical protein
MEFCSNGKTLTDNHVIQRVTKVKLKAVFSGFVRHCGLYKPIVPSPLELPSFTTRGAAYQPDTQRTLLAKVGTNEILNLASNFVIFEESWVLLHASKLGHRTDYFTSPPKEGMLWILPAGKIRRDLGYQRSAC